MSSKRVPRPLPENVQPAAIDAEACLVLPYLTDEAIISLVPRYHVQKANPSADRTLNALFDTQIIKLHHWIPRHLDRLAEYMPGQTDPLLEGLVQHERYAPYAGSTSQFNRPLASVSSTWPRTERGYSCLEPIHTGKPCSMATKKLRTKLPPTSVSSK